MTLPTQWVGWNWVSIILFVYTFGYSECGSGYYLDTLNDECVLCAIGTYSVTNVNRCTACPVGYTTSDEGSTSLSHCHIGWF